MNNTDNTSGLCKWRKASENPIPEGYVGVIRNLHPLGVYQYTRWDKDYPGVNATAEWLEELPTPETTPTPDSEFTLSDIQQSFKRDPVSFLLANALNHLSEEQLILLRDKLIARTPGTMQQEEEWTGNSDSDIPIVSSDQWIAIPTYPETPPVGPLVVKKGENGIPVRFPYTGSSLSFILLRDQYTHYFPIQQEDKEPACSNCGNPGEYSQHYACPNCGSQHSWKVSKQEDKQ